MNESNKKIDIKALVLGAFVGAAIVFSVAAASANGGRTIWEYKTVAGKVLGAEEKLDDAINRNIAQGWDFVSASHSIENYGFALMRRESRQK